MKELIIRKGLTRSRVMLYNDIEQLPVERFNKANKFWMLSDNIGNSFDDIDKTHLSRMFLVADNKEKIVKEINNLRVLVYNVLAEVHPNQLAFAALVHSIDGKECNDLSDDGLLTTIQELSNRGLTIGEVKKKILKEKIFGDLEVCFPDYFKSGVTTAFWQTMKKRVLRQIEELQGQDRSKEIKEIDKYMAQFVEPKEFIGAGSYELKYDRDFEKNCIVLSEYANKSVKSLTTKEYFMLLQHHNQLMKEREKHKK